MAAAAKPPKAKPTIIIVAGAWHGLIHIAPLTTALSSQKYPTIPLALTTSGNSDKNLTDDIAMITSHLEEVIGKQGKDVILVLHSFGGVPGCAAAGPFVRSARKKQDQKGGIMAILFIAAFAVPKGMTFLQTLGGKHAPFVVEEVTCPGALIPSIPLNSDRVDFVTRHTPSTFSTTTCHRSTPSSTRLNWCRMRWRVSSRWSLMTASMALCRVLIYSVRGTMVTLHLRRRSVSSILVKDVGLRGVMLDIVLI